MDREQNNTLLDMPYGNLRTLEKADLFLQQGYQSMSPRKAPAPPKQTKQPTKSREILHPPNHPPVPVPKTD